MKPYVPVSQTDVQITTRDDSFNSFANEWSKRVNDKLEDEKQPGEGANQVSRTTILIGVFQVLLVILFGSCVGSEVLSKVYAVGSGTQGYNMFVGVVIMMFVGFGYLMTFLKWYGLSAIGQTMMIVAVGVQWAVFTESFWGQVYNEEGKTSWEAVDFNVYTLLNALFAISAVLISFGALIGKTSPLQLLVLAFVEIFCQSFNFKILMSLFSLADMGGTYTAHMFGAYFGLAAAYVIGKPRTLPELGYVPDMFSLLGTIFLWVYWPSFVAGAAVADSVQQQRAFVHTILSLSASTVGTYCLTSLLSPHGKFRPVDLQNATLAGGVAIGCTANLSLGPFGAVLIGLTAGLVSTIGFNIVQPYLETNYGLYDSCGIHNLHGMPAIVGAIASAILAGYNAQKETDAAIYGEHVATQNWRQIGAMIVCIGFALIAGAFTGRILNMFYGEKCLDEEKHFHDNVYWDVAEDYGRSITDDLKTLNAASDSDENSVITDDDRSVHSAGLQSVASSVAVSSVYSGLHHRAAPTTSASFPQAPAASQPAPRPAAAPNAGYGTTTTNNNNFNNNNNNNNRGSIHSINYPPHSTTTYHQPQPQPHQPVAVRHHARPTDRLVLNNINYGN